MLAMAAPEQGPTLAVELCLYFNFSSTCESSFRLQTLGSPITQVIANADVGSLDGQVLLETNVRSFNSDILFYFWSDDLPKLLRWLVSPATYPTS